MRILITGGAGFIGSHVSEYYAKRGEHVVVLDNLSRAEIFGMNPKTALYNWEYLKKNYTTIKLVKGDVRNLEEVQKAAKDADAIIHAAAQVAVTTSVKDPRTDFEANVLGTFNVLEAARNSKTDPSIIYCSTNKVYGTNVDNIPLREEETRYNFADAGYRKGIPEDFPIDLCGHTPYGCSKLAGDLYAQDYAHTYGLKTGVFRMSCIYGSKQFGVEDQGWVAWFVIANLTGKPITIYGNGKQVRDVLHVSDLALAYDAFINSRLKHEVFNMGGGSENTLSLLELLAVLEETTGRKTRIAFADWRPGDQKVYISDVTKAHKKLGWKPKVSPQKGILNLTEWGRQNIELLK